MQHAGGPDTLQMDPPPPGTEPRALPLECRHCQGAETDMLLPVSCPEAQKVPTQANPEVMARWLPTEVPPGPPFRLMFQGSYNLPLIPQESGNPGTGAEINTQVAHRSGSSNPPGRNHMPPAKQGNLLKPRKEAGSSYPGTRKEFAARGLPLQLLQVCED